MHCPFRGAPTALRRQGAQQLPGLAKEAPVGRDRVCDANGGYGKLQPHKGSPRSQLDGTAVLAGAPLSAEECFRPRQSIALPHFRQSKPHAALPPYRAVTSGLSRIVGCLQNPRKCPGLCGQATKAKEPSLSARELLSPALWRPARLHVDLSKLAAPLSVWPSAEVHINLASSALPYATGVTITDTD